MRTTAATWNIATSIPSSTALSGAFAIGPSRRFTATWPRESFRKTGRANSTQSVSSARHEWRNALRLLRPTNCAGTWKPSLTQRRYELRRAHRDLRWWRDRCGDRLLHKPTRRAIDRPRASRRRRRGLRQVGRLPGARLVWRQPARSIGAAKFQAPCRTFRRARRSLGLSAADDLRRL